MSILNLLQQAQGGQGIANLAGQLGIGADKADELVGLLGPAIGSAARKQAETGGLDQILGSLRGEDQGALFDDAEAAAGDAGQAQGAAFLESLLGGASGRTEIEAEAANRSGVDLATISKFLPAIAAMAQGGLQKNLPDSAIDAMQPTQAAGGGGLMGMLGGLLGGRKQAQSGGLDLSVLNNLLDADGDGSAMDDILGKFIR